MELTKEEQIKSLEKFMLDIDCLSKLEEWCKEVNFFEVTGIANQEIKHSNFLAWLFNANENHGLGDVVIKNFIQKVIAENSNKEINSSILKVSLLDYDTFLVKREWENIDIFLVSEKEKFTITIENKVYATERKNQTVDYRTIVETHYPSNEYTNLFIFLTREGVDAEDKNYWCNANYKMIIEAIEKAEQKLNNISNQVKILLNSYISIIKRKIIMDDQIKKICEEIYIKHKDALNLIIENIPNNVNDISNHIKDYIEANKEKYGLIFNREDCTPSYIRFKTKYIEELIPAIEDKSFGWNNGQKIMYEFEVLNHYKASCILTISDITDEKCLKLFEITQAKSKECGVTRRSSNPKTWARLFRSSVILNKEQIESSLCEIEEILDKNLKKIFEIEIPKFEKILKENFENKY